VNRPWKALWLGAGLMLLAVGFLSVGCGSGSTQFRFVNAFTGPNAGSMDILVDTVSTFTNVATNTATAYAGISGGSHQITIEPSGTTSPIFNPPPAISFPSGNNTTLIGDTNSSFVNTFVTFTDQNTAPVVNDYSLRVICLAFTPFKNVDIYIYPYPSSPPLNITNLSPTLTNLTFNGASSYLTKTIGNYDIVVSQTGTKAEIIDTGQVSFGSQQVRTFVVLNNSNYLILSDLN